LEKTIRALLNDSILKEAAGIYGFDHGGLTDLHGFQNFVYRARRDSQMYILRIAHSSHRSLEMTEAELEWIQYLVRHGVNAAAPITSIEGKLAGRVNLDDSYFVVTAFEKAEGGKPDGMTFMENNDMIRKLGRLTGKIHALSKKFPADKRGLQRKNWNENHYLSKFADYIPAPYTHVIEKTNQFMDGLHSLPRDPDGFGLIHGDINFNNFHVYNGELTLFDFDECEYNWYVADIANPLFYVTPLPSDGEDKRNRAAKRFYDHFMDGYARENTLDALWLKRMPQFLRLREILVYSGAFRSLDLNDLHPWSKEMLETTTRNLEHDLPFLEIDFA